MCIELCRGVVVEYKGLCALRSCTLHGGLLLTYIRYH